MRRLGLILVVVMLLTACGGRSGNDQADTISSTSSVAAASSTQTVASEAITSTPTVNATVATINTPASTPVSTPAVTAVAGLPTEDDLKPLLLTLSDMPVGWTTWDSGDDDTSSQLCGQSTNAEFDTVDVSAGFQKSELGPFVSESIVQFKDNDAKKSMDLLRSAFTCTDDTITGNDGTPTPVHYAPLSFPKIGDDTFALRMTIDTGIAGELTADTVYVRSGSRVIAFVNMELGSVDSDLTQHLVEIAVKRSKG